MDKLTKVRWGIIGVGDVCEVKSGPAFQKIEGSELIAVMRRNKVKAQDYADRHNVSKCYDNVDSLIADPDINAVYIATPPHVREEYARKVAEAGKAVYLEKPMARTHAECERIIEICDSYNVPLFVAYFRRRLPNFIKIKELLSEGAIGDVRHVNIMLNTQLESDIIADSEDGDNWRVDPERAGGGYFYDLASHQLDVLDYLLGPIVDASGFALNQAGAYKAEDITSGSFYFENQIVGQGTWCFNAGTSSVSEKTLIVGSRGQIEFNFFGDLSVLLSTDDGNSERFTFDFPAHIQQPLIETIVGELRGEGKCPSTGITAARTARVMDMICRRVDA